MSTFGYEKKLTLAAWRIGVAWLLAAVPVTGQSTSGGRSAARGDGVQWEASVPMALARIGAGIVLDGRPDEAAWQSVQPLPLVTYEPAWGQAPSEPTEILIAYDDRHLYVAGRMYESDPRRIRRSSLYRDRWSGDDRLGVLIDPFDDNETGLWFWTTPAGVRGDALVSGDGAGISDDWNTHWDVAVLQTDEGWFAEMRIPLSSLGFQRSGDRVTMGVIAHRDLTGRNERHVFPDISADFSWRRPSLARDVTLEGVESGRPLYVSPFLLTGTRSSAELAVGASAYHVNRESPLEAGVDLRYPIRPNLTLDLTANTDFAQVEADGQQVNLTRFGLFYPEKRQFFLERAGIFSFGTGGADRVFHSRRIGLESGRPVRILGGARMAGRVGDWDVGLLDLQTESTAGLASINHGVARLRRRIFNQFSTAGAIVTSRLGDDGSYNLAAGLDSQVRWAGNDYVGIEAVRTFDDGEGEGRAALREQGRNPGALDASLVRVRAWRAAQQGFTYFVSGRFVGPLYRPGTGFLLRPDVSDFNYSFAYARIFGEDSAVRRVDPFQLFGNVVVRNGDRSVESAQIEYDTDILWKSGWGAWQDFELYYDDIRTPVSLPASSTVPVGSYWYFRTEGGVFMPPGSLLRASVNWGWQRFFDGTRWNVNVFPVWNVSSHLTLVGQYRLDVVRFPRRDQGFDSHLAQLRVQTAFDTRLSVSAFLQYSSVADEASANVRLRYNFREGTDLWIVYDEGLNLDRDLLDPRPPLSGRRAVMIKYTHTVGG